MSTLNSRLQLSILNRKKSKNIVEKGFTLVELMIVIVVVGVLSAVALPNFLGVKDKADVASQIGGFMGLAKECSSAILMSGPYPEEYPADENDYISADCWGGTIASAPDADIVFTGKKVPKAAAGTISCGPDPELKEKMVEDAGCEITVDHKTGQISFDVAEAGIDPEAEGTAG
jgi:type IV pilus assembly protein PilA